MNETEGRRLEQKVPLLDIYTVAIMAAQKQTTTITIYSFCNLEALQWLYFQYLLNSNNKTKTYNY